jgi:predicted  nucleic acid-binding Zn-ribbon protein
MAILDLKEQIKLLVEVQGLDSHIFKLKDDMDGIPVRIKVIEGSFREKTANLKRMEDSLKQLQVKRKEREVDLETKEGAIKKYQSQLYQVKTNKEYAALQEEIERARADNSLVEEDIIKILDQIDADNREIAKEKDFIKKEEQGLNDEKKKLEWEGQSIKEEIDKIETQRKELASKVEKNILARYEKILKNRDGLAVVPVAGDSCQGCFRRLPPQVINEIMMGSDIIVCENCTRILYIEE